MLCSLLKVNQLFGGKCCFHLQGKRISQARKQCEADSKQCNQLAKILIYTGNRRAKQHKSVQEGLHGAVSQKVELFIAALVRISNPVDLYVVIFRKITVWALEAQMLNGNFLKTGFTDQTNFTVLLSKSNYK
jgi:hypothetical protein